MLTRLLQPFAAIALGLVLALGAPTQIHAAQVINSKGDILSLTLNSGKLVQLDKPATSVFVGNPELADVQVQSPTIIYVFGKGTGSTNLFALDAQGRVLLNSPISITHDVTSLNDALQGVSPNGGLAARSTPTGIMLTGRVKSAAQAEDARRLAELYLGGGTVFNRIEVAGAMQVNLRVRIAEVSRSITKQFGVNWEVFGRIGDAFLGFATPTDIVGSGASGVTRLGSGTNYASGYSSKNFDMLNVIDALDEEGLLTILAEPNLTALSGETAKFLAGGEFPIPVPQEDGAVTVEYKPFGVSLEFKPIIVDDNLINLQVKPEVSQLSSSSAINVGGSFIQSILTRRAETTVELSSGQSFAIGGLLSSDGDNNISKTPFLGDIPILGALFRSSSFQRNETELLIIVTPYLVKPSNSRIAEPTDGYIPPNDNDLYVDGKNFRPTLGENAPEKDGRDAAAAAAPTKDIKLAGPAGFILE
ncbi:type II and III secretion system protein family protein [Sneathiella litorea]|uniref:Type II and III secretion system protein family protein n=1 Tax=Sneathiella litorea TaxID=2606216 RepID=A0A6L8W9V0_9PROT|nr:type II and III secretion system protein family protein [Sneathiella litorea]MZR31908.1 type II and III secretion system protein family protein [Sneathiella litorea]